MDQVTPSLDHEETFEIFLKESTNDQKYIYPILKMLIIFHPK